MSVKQQSVVHVDQKCLSVSQVAYCGAVAAYGQLRVRGWEPGSAAHFQQRGSAWPEVYRKAPGKVKQERLAAAAAHAAAESLSEMVQT